MFIEGPQFIVFDKRAEIEQSAARANLPPGAYLFGVQLFFELPEAIRTESGELDPHSFFNSVGVLGEIPVYIDRWTQGVVEKIEYVINDVASQVKSLHSAPKIAAALASGLWQGFLEDYDVASRIRALTPQEIDRYRGQSLIYDKLQQLSGQQFLSDPGSF